MNENRHAEPAKAEEEPLFSAFSAPPRETTPSQTMPKPNPIPELANLTEAQLDTLNRWLAEHPVSKVAQLAAAPAPEGFGLQFGRDILSRHHHRQQVLARFEAHRELAQEIERLYPGPRSGRTEDIWLDLVAEKAYTLILEPGQSPQTMKILLGIATFRQRHELALARLRLAEHKAGLKPTQPAGRSPHIPARPTAHTNQTAPASASSPRPHAFAPLRSAPPSPRQEAEFRALAKTVGLTEQQLADKLLYIIRPEAPAPAPTPAKPL